MLKKLTALLFVISCSIALGQECNYSLSGKVIDFHDNSRLSGALVYIRAVEKGTRSDDAGNYSFDGLCNGRFELIVSHPACDPVFITVEVNGDTERDLKLEHHVEELDEVQLIGETVKNKMNSAQERHLSSAVIERYSSATLGDALKEIGGVTGLSTGANIVKPTIHGLNGSRVLILNDGVRMQDMEWGEEHAPNIDINSAGSISVIKGAAALQYGGDAIGGVIVLDQTFKTLRDTLFGKTIANGMTNGRGGNISTELTKVFDKGWFIKGQASYKRLGDREAPDYVLSNTGVQETGLSIRFGKKNFAWGWDAWYSYFDTDIAILRASHIGNIDDLIRSINSGQPLVIEPFTYDIGNPRQEVTHQLGKLNIYKRFEGKGKWNLRYDYQNNRRFEYDLRLGEDRNIPAIDLELQTHTINTDFLWDAHPTFELRTGLLGRYQNNFANPDTGVRRLIPDYDKYDLGLFAIGEYQLTDQWLLEAGLRYDLNRIDALKYYRSSRWIERGYDQDFSNFVVEDFGNQLLTNPVFDYHNFSGTAGTQYKLNGSVDFRLNYTLAQRAPNPSELFSDGLHHSAARIELGDLRIGRETSHKLAVSYQRSFDSWSFLLEPYANIITDFILLEPTGTEFTIRGAFPLWTYRQTNARLLGIDMAAFVDWTPDWKTEHKFSIVKGKDTDNNIALINIPAANLTNKIIFTKNEWKNLKTGMESLYVFRQNEYPPNITVFSPEQQQDVILEINTPPDAYHLLRFFADVEFTLGGQTRLGAGLSINNLLNTNYRDYLNRLRYFADDLGRNFILQLNLKY
ncbi:MAG: TonB-dependent receptor [Flavobacteriaceae bacterium]